MANGDAATWQCAVCAEANSCGASCWACGRPRPRIDWPRRMRRIGAIAIGIALHIAAGILIWIFPPGASMWSWAAYLGMGIVGFLHIFIGGEMLRRDLRASGQLADESPEPAFTHAAMGFQDHRCPRCESSISRAIESGARRCPSCASPFSMRELGWPYADPAGEPSTLAPGELRISGTVLLTSLAMLTVAALIALLALSGALP